MYQTLHGNPLLYCIIDYFIELVILPLSFVHDLRYILFKAEQMIQLKD